MKVKIRESARRIKLLAVYEYRKDRMLILFLIFTFIYGFASARMPQSKVWQYPIYIFYIGIYMTLLLKWCHYDSRIQSYKIPKFVKIILLISSPIGIPLYLFKSRGVKDAFKMIALLILYSLIIMGVLKLSIYSAQLFMETFNSYEFIQLSIGDK